MLLAVSPKRSIRRRASPGSRGSAGTSTALIRCRSLRSTSRSSIRAPGNPSQGPDRQGQPDIDSGTARCLACSSPTRNTVASAPAGTGHPGPARRTMAAKSTLDSLQRRMRAMHSLYYDAVATMDIDQVNHFEREGVLPIAFSLFHIVNMIDASFLLMTGTPPIWDDTWEARIRPAIADHGKHRTVEEMVHQRIGDYAAFQDYMAAVFNRTEEWLENVDPDQLDRVVVGRPF